MNDIMFLKKEILVGKNENITSRQTSTATGKKANESGISTFVSGVLASSESRKAVISSETCISPICRLPRKRITAISET